MTVKVTDVTLASEVKEGITLVDFWAPWCGPCKMLGPVLEELEAEFAPEIKIAKLNIDENNVIASQLGIMSIPTMVLYKDGQPIEKIVGYQPKEVLKEYLMEKVTAEFFKKTPTISTTELENKLSEKPQIIDVREPHEFKIGHIPGAKNIPLAKVSTYTPKGQVYVVCQSGMRSKRATKILLKQGHDVINVRGGMMAWAGAKKGGKN